MINEVFVVVIQERHSGIGVLGVFTDRDAALARADAELAEYSIDVSMINIWETPSVVGMSWGDGNMIMVERTRLTTGNMVDEVLIVWQLHGVGSSDDGELYATVDAAKYVASTPWPDEPPIELTWVEQLSEVPEVPGVASHYGTSPEGYEYMIYPRRVWSGEKSMGALPR